ncbi:hypothetical protein SLEP1_g34233 [Rubroshorea leprosula]|uniref:Uncharacterized protein n=1 Tax=Rubroshorea leprosula TaxID=152421 RepID=A0AAV5KJA2_9ROSI|nr:hypothetical protein SLEP1_g34233 [Rubroshorea leprosula]
MGSELPNRILIVSGEKRIRKESAVRTKASSKTTIGTAPTAGYNINFENINSDGSNLGSAPGPQKA